MLVELARAFLHAYENPGALTEARLRALAPLFEVLLGQDEPLATNDVTALWTYVLHGFEVGSPVRIMIEETIQGRPREMYTTIADSLIAEGEAKVSNDLSFGELDGQTTYGAKNTTELEGKVMGQSLASAKVETGVAYTTGPNGEQVIVEGQYLLDRFDLSEPASHPTASAT